MTPTIGQTGRRLHIAQAANWLRWAAGDPHADVLRGLPAEPAAGYARARARGPLWRDGAGAWATGRHACAAELLNQPGLRPWLPAPMDRALEAGRRGVVDPALLGPDFRPRVHRICARTLDELPGEFDLVADLAERLPVEALAELLGVEPSTLAGPCAAAAVALDAMACPQRLDATRRMLEAVDELDDLTRGQGAAGGLALAVVGVRVAADLLANAMLAVLGEPAARPWLDGGPDRAPGIVREAERLCPPVQLCDLEATADLVVAGREVAAGDRVAVLIGAAHRDEDAFADPDRFHPGRFDPARSEPGRPAPRLARPPWLGGALAEFAVAQAEIALPMAVSRLATLRLAGPPLRRPRAPVTRGLSRLPVSVERS